MCFSHRFNILNVFARFSGIYERHKPNPRRERLNAITLLLFGFRGGRHDACRWCAFGRPKRKICWKKFIHLARSYIPAINLERVPGTLISFNYNNVALAQPVARAVGSLGSCVSVERCLAWSLFYQFECEPPCCVSRGFVWGEGRATVDFPRTPRCLRLFARFASQDPGPARLSRPHAKWRRRARIFSFYLSIWHPKMSQDSVRATTPTTPTTKSFAQC